jgi:hypothetical protein
VLEKLRLKIAKTLDPNLVQEIDASVKPEPEPNRPTPGRGAYRRGALLRQLKEGGGMSAHDQAITRATIERISPAGKVW